MSDEKIVQDKIGQDIRVGSIVAVPNSKTNLEICRVIKIMPKQLRCEKVEGNISRWHGIWNKYHNEVICLDEMEQTVMYMMSRNL